MVHERERARMMNYSDPIHENAERTHRCFDDVVEHLLRHRISRGPGSEIVIATHNETSIRKAVDLMSELGLAPNDECVHFAQLYGMSDHLTFALGRNGYNAYKYLPYGKVREVIPYLVRRAQENGDVLGNTGTELRLLHEELRRRCSFA
jgi:proline dehydrogenase